MPFSFVQYPGNGSTVSFAVPFPYLLRSHVRLYYGLNFISGGYTQLLVDGTDYNWNTGGTQITLTSPPGSGALLTIRRETPTANRLVDFADGSNLIEQNLDTAGLQNLYVVQEQQDRNDAVAAQQISTTELANATAAAVANVLLYTTVPNVTGIPAAPDNNERVEVLNSAGIESFIPLTGRPVGFVGSSQLKVRLTYSTASSTWIWVDYVSTDPDSRYLRIASDGGIYLAKDPNAIGMRAGSAGQLILIADSSGLFHQAGSSYYLVTTAGGSTSDARLKKDIGPIANPLQKLSQIRGVTFRFIEEPVCDPDKGRQLGVLAQEVEPVFPEAVVTKEDGIKSVRYEKLVAPLIEAVNQLASSVASQKILIQNMAQRLSKLEGS